MATLVGKLLFSGVAFAFALFGVGIIKFARMMTASVRAMEATETTPAGEVTPGGAVEVSGTVEPAEEGTVETPLYGREAVDAITLVQRRVGGGEPKSWQTYHDERTRVPFVVADDSGAVRVEPPDDAMPAVRMEWERFGAGADASETARAYLSGVERANVDVGIDIGPVSMGSRQRCGEGALEPGDEVRVYGRAADAPAGWDGPEVAVTGGDDTHFVYADTDEVDAAEGTPKIAIGLYAFGGLWIALCLFGGIVPWLAG